jgi:hypothetical protein
MGNTPDDATFDSSVPPVGTVDTTSEVKKASIPPKNRRLKKELAGLLA